MRLTCEVETLHEVMPSATNEGSFSKQPKCKATVVVGRNGSRGLKKKKAERAGDLEDDSIDDVYENTCIIVQTSRNPSGVQYKISNNVRKVYSKFVGEGKGTVCFRSPPHSLAFSKAEPSQLKTLLSLLRVAALPDSRTHSDARTINVPDIQASSLALKTGDLPKSRMRITSKAAYPLTGFPRHLEQLEASSINLSRLDTRICRLQQLTCLDVSNNQIEVLPDCLKDCRLTELKMSGNKIEAFPPVICSGVLGSAIKVLDLSRNNLKVLPNNISLMQQLSHLKVDCNRLSAIPRNFGKLSKLQFLSASGNQLKVLPHSFANLRLESIDLFGNPFQSPGVVSRSGDLSLPPLMELAARTVRKSKIKYDATFVPVVLCHRLDMAKKCLCGNACFDVYLRHVASLSLHKVSSTVTSTDTQGSMSVPMEMFLCQAKCLKLWKH